MLCRGCGNEIPDAGPCPVCEAVRQRRRAEQGARRSLCLGCGNEILGDEPCRICEAGRAHTRKHDPTLSLCRRCGNEVENPNDCPICKAGRASGKKLRLDDGPKCPQCEQVLENRELDGVMVLMCPDCAGTLFPPGGLERTLDKVRASAKGVQLASVLKEFRVGRLHAKQVVRYRACPVCQIAMLRRNYAAASGIIVDVCGSHGTWVSQHTFGELADFICRGGDVYAARSPLRRRR